ncbi:MAG TPA: hypothetical protein ENO08_03860, partial [Candidatus Eisenbacteria bacterium]|nr:hypothetical protein [Candidatus Eisenbacteria bacterium]
MSRTGILIACLLSTLLLARPAEPAAEGGAEPAAEGGAEPAAEGGADELLRRTLDALGGAGALSEIRSIVSTADIEMPGLGVKGTMASRRMMPCLYRIDIRLGFFEISQGCDGDGMWRIDSNGMLVHLQDPASAAERVTICLIESYRYLLSDEGYTAAVAGSDTVGGSSCTVLEIVPEGGIPCRLSIDDATDLPVRLSMTTKNGPVSETYGDYRPVGGIMFPHFTRIRQAAADQTIVARTLSIEVNEPVDPLLFLPPPGSADDYSFTGGGGSAMVPFTTHDRHIYIPVRL